MGIGLYISLVQVDVKCDAGVGWDIRGDDDDVDGN